MSHNRFYNYGLFFNMSALGWLEKVLNLQTFSVFTYYYLYYNYLRKLFTLMCAAVSKSLELIKLY